VSILMNPYDSQPQPAVQADSLPGSASNKLFKVSTRFTGIQTFNKDAALQLWFNVGNIQSKASGVAKVDPSFHVGAYHTWNLGDLGSNLIGFNLDSSKVSDGAGGNLTELKWRAVVQHGIIFAAAKTGLDLIAEYRSDKVKGAPAATWFMVGARTDTQISGPFRFLLEAGYDNQKSPAINGDKSTNLFKATGALAVSGGNDPWSRPTFRLFYTYGSWSDVGVLADGRANGIFGDKKSGGQYGIQAEGWW
jgi:maltoporin